jgi:hypothetical protein
VPKRSGVILYATHVDGRGRDLFAEVCARDLEGIVAKLKASAYDPASPVRFVGEDQERGLHQARDRHERFER